MKVSEIKMSFKFYDIQEKIAIRTTGAKGYYFLAVFLQISNVFITHLNVSNKSLTSLSQVSHKSLESVVTSDLTNNPEMTPLKRKYTSRRPGGN